MNEELARAVCSALKEYAIEIGYWAPYEQEYPSSVPECYTASETYYHLAGGKKAGLTPMRILHEGTRHWYLRTADWEFIDLTSAQFTTPVPYEQGRGCGFLTRSPSRKAEKLIGKTRKQLATT